MTFDQYKDTYLPNSLFRETAQICLVTRDLDALIRAYADKLSIGPWWVQDYRPPELRDTTFRGRPAAYSMRLAMAWTGAMNWEIIEPLDGPNIYDEFLKLHGEGVQHIGVLLEHTGMSWQACYEAFRKRGMAPLQEGAWDRIRFCYFDTEGPAWTVIEVIDRPADWQRPEPLYWYPARPAEGEAAAGVT